VGCATPATSIVVMPMSAGSGISTCGYTLTANGGYQHVWTGPQGVNFAFVPMQAPLGSAPCGRCAEFTRTTAANTFRVTATVVGDCNPAQCGNGVQLSPAAYQILAQDINTPAIPLAGETLTWRYVECPVPVAADGQPERIRATVRLSTDATRGQSVKFLGQRYGILSVRTILGGSAVDLAHGSDNFWATSNNLPFGPNQATFTLTDVNNATSQATITITTTEQTTNTQFPVCP
jgi:hypothetical protein